MSPALTNGHAAPITNGHAVPTTNGHSKPAHHEDGFGTRAIHVGSEPSPETGAVIPSISLSTTFKQDAIGVHKGYEYSRSSNPNRAALETALASLESGGAHALAFASGSAATATVLQSLGPHAHIISVNDVYGGTFRYMTKVAGLNQGLETTFLDLESVEEGGEGVVLEAIRPNTKLIWVESPTNPTLRLISIPLLSRLLSTLPASSRPLLLVDNTFLSPFFSSPLLLGADIVLHSITKYINGHSDVVMGALILPATQSAAYEKLKFLQNAGGAVPSAFDSWLAQRGVKTLHLRMKQHGLNALLLAHALQSHPHIEAVIYPGLASHPRNALARASLSPHARSWIASLPATVTEHGFPYGGMISLRLRSTSSGDALVKAEKFLTSLRLFSLAESLGGVESLAEHPARMTHGSIPEKERAELGIGEGLVRLSVGVEEGVDLVRDVLGALEVVYRSA